MIIPGIAIHGVKDKMGKFDLGKVFSRTSSPRFLSEIP
jgi:hypothetical protein